MVLEKNNTSILIIDDDDTTLITLKKFLSKYDITICNSSLAALEILKHQNFDIVITDLNLPNLDGFSILSWIKNNKPQIKVILISGHEELSKKATNVGGINFLKKPVKSDVINSLVEEMTSDKGFTGSFYHINLDSFILLPILSSENCVLSVKHSQTNQEGLIFIYNKKIVHAEFSRLIGNKALQKLRTLPLGKITKLNWFEPRDFTMDVAYSNLLSDDIHKSLDSNNFKILFVDDDDTSLIMANKFFQKLGYNITTFNNAKDAIDKLKKEFFNLVITDINMPQINGLELLLWINENTPRTQVAIVTSSELPEYKAFAEKHLALKYFKKPLNPKELRDFIEKSKSNEGFSGIIEYINLIDYLKVLVLSKTSKIVSISDPLASKGGNIYIKNGNIIHSEYLNLTGKEAFLKLLSLKNGLFVDMPWQDPKQQTIKESFIELIKDYQDISVSKKENIQTKPNTNIEEIKTEKAIEDKSEKNKENTITENEINNTPIPYGTIVKASERFVKRASEKIRALTLLEKEVDPLKKLTIYEAGVALKLISGKTTKSEVVEIMKGYSNVFHPKHENSRYFIYDDISVTILFNEYDVIEEIRFYGNYKGLTSLGLKLGDPIERAIELFGKPKVCTIKGAAWDNIAVFCQMGKVISSINIRNNDFFEKENAPNNLVTDIVKTPLNANVIKKTDDNEVKINIETNEKEKITIKVETTSKDENEFVKRFKDQYDNFIVDILNREFLGLQIGKSSKEDVCNIMNKISPKGLTKETKNILCYDKDGVYYSFDEHSRTLEEITFTYPIKIITKRGIVLGMNVSDFISIYGNYKWNSSTGYFWDNFSVYVDSNIITSIRLN